RMRTAWVIVLVLSGANAARAQVDGGAGASQSDIEKAMAADAAQQRPAAGAAAAPTAQPDTAQAPTTGSGFGSALGRVFQSLNPDLSALLDLAAGWYQDDAGTIKSGDDPGGTGFNVQEVELALQAVVDPYFRADVFLTIPNLQG